LDLLKDWGTERLIITGMMTHMCVDATTRAAVDLGFQVLVASDACATRDLTFEGTTVSAGQVHKAFLAALKSYGEVLPTEQVLARLAAELENE
jgi:nicotinamidase-related amidase